MDTCCTFKPGSMNALLPTHWFTVYRILEGTVSAETLEDSKQKKKRKSVSFTP